jgi:hypothetical protein
MSSLNIRDIRGAVWFDFEYKSHRNRKIKMYAVRFGVEDLVEVGL